MKKLLAILLLAGLAAGPCFGAAARAEPVRLISVEAQPWSWTTPEGRLQGAFAELAAELERRSGLDIIATVSSFPRIERDLAQGAQDCAILVWSEGNAGALDKGETVVEFPFGVIARKGLPLDRYEDLWAMRLSVTRQLSFHPRFDHDALLVKDRDQDYATGLQKLARARVDGIAGALPTIRWQAAALGLADHLGAELRLGASPIVLQCARAAPGHGALEPLNATLRAMKADGSLATILKRNHY